MALHACPCLMTFCAQARIPHRLFMPSISLPFASRDSPHPCATQPNRSYRGLYVLNWIYRFYTEPHYRQWLVWISGLVQTGLYADFFYYYFLCWKNNQKLSLPA